MKKYLGLTLSAVLLLAGCGNKTTSTAATENSLPSAAAETAAPAETTAAAESKPAEESSEPEEEEKAFDLSIYDEIIKSDYELICNGPDGVTDLQDGQYGLHDIQYLEDIPTLLKLAGYAYKDMNNDGIEELIIGTNYSAIGFLTNATIINAMYTVKNNEPVLLLEGSTRSTYYLLNDDTLFYVGSNGAASSISGHYLLKDGEDQLSCDDFCFSEPKDDNPLTPIYYHNETGIYDTEQAEEFSNEEFKAWYNKYCSQFKEIELTSFRTYGQGPVSAEYDPANPGWVIFTAREDVTDFKVLEVEFKETASGYTFETVAVDDTYGDLKQGESTSRLFEMAGDLPGYAISYKDSKGNEHSYTVSQSGYDGSVDLAEY